MHSSRDAQKEGILMNRMYQPEIETASREEMKALQTERLINTVKRVFAESSPTENPS